MYAPLNTPTAQATAIDREVKVRGLRILIEIFKKTCVDIIGCVQ